MGARAADQTGYKALVCVNFAGGLDNHDLLIGHDQPSYDLWTAGRQALVDLIDNGPTPGIRARDNLLRLNPTNNGDFGGRDFAMPPELSGIRNLFEDGKLAIVPNVGPLIEPVNRTTFFNGSALLPRRLRSHNDQASTWQALETEGARMGWGGLMLDAFTQDSPYTAISLAGQSVFVSGNRSRQTIIPPSGQVREAYGTNGNAKGSARIAQILQDYYQNAAANATNPMMRDYIRLQGEAINTSGQAAAILNTQNLGDSVVVPNNPLSEQLGTVANMIAARDQFGINRQVFFVELGGFDVHRDHATVIPRLFEQLSVALTNFQDALDTAGLGDMVTTFTMSEFGRTLVANANGTDHGWGGHHLVMGGAVRGRQIYGDIPTYDLDGDQVDPRGSLLPQIAIEQMGSDLGSWFGLTPSDLDTVFPNRGRFDTTPLGLFT
ncbi:MAG: DUF1501 domain-containing protein [Pseudomonadota bacterium]